MELSSHKRTQTRTNCLYKSSQTCQKYSQTCSQIFANMFTNLRKHVHKSSQTCSQIFANMFTNLRKNFHKYSQICLQIFVKMFTNFQKPVHKFSQTCSQIFTNLFTNFRKHVYRSLNCFYHRRLRFFFKNTYKPMYQQTHTNQCFNKRIQTNVSTNAYKPMF